MDEDLTKNDDNNSRVITVDVSNEMRTSYLNYAMSVIVSRALPDVRDGLKPVHRRILTFLVNTTRTETHRYMMPSYVLHRISHSAIRL